MAKVRPELETCPSCGRCGMVIHCYYGRKLIDFEDGKPVESDICILRIACPSCEHTHAVLPDIIVPYSSHSLLFILQVLAAYFLRPESVEKICLRYEISLKRLYSWLKLWKTEKAHWLGVLAELETSSLAFLYSLMQLDRFSEFTSGFLLHFGKSFLQTHANPVLTNPPTADYRRCVFAPDYDLL